MRLQSGIATMLSITKCKDVLNKNGIKYEDNEIEKLREMLYALAKIQLNKSKN